MADRAPFRLYLVTDRAGTNGRPLLSVIEQALHGGVDAVQLRERDLPTKELLELAHHVRDLCRRHNARLLVNDRIDVALAVGADGVHLPASSFLPADARRLLGPQALIGVSTHRSEDIGAAAAGGADFVVFGPVFDTPSKRPFGAPLGLDALAAATQAVALPVLAIGGITAARVDAVRHCGACGVAVISAIGAADDPRAAAAALRALI